MVAYRVMWRFGFQWKVRRTLAFSIHELAIILGDQLTAADLVPIFNGFLKDLDEVRIGVLKHLYDFLKLLHKEMRREYLYQLQEFLVTDNSRNWRFRAELAEQLVLLLDLYCSKDVYDYLRPLAFSLCMDKVSSVRWTSYKLIREIIRKLSSDSALVADFMAELVAKFCHCPKWSGRQAFAFVCQSVIEDDCVSMDLFAEHMLPPLLQLACDPVPNVRVLLAKILRHSLLEKDYFIHSASSHQEALEQTLVALQVDLDKDVQYFASVHYIQFLLYSTVLIYFCQCVFFLFVFFTVRENNLNVIKPFCLFQTISYTLPAHTRKPWSRPWWHSDYFIHSASSHQEALEQTLVALQVDLDKDVQYFASVHPASTRLADDAMSTTSSTY
ncbi:UNVERIFIED_CONTAM: hypothetical protein FKN15_057329 [Acipenser sinensis]